MPITIGANIASLAAQRRLDENTSAVARVSERLASGMRINHAADDAAGLAVAGSLQAGARVFGQAMKNVNDGVSTLSIADGALQQLSTILQRHKELAEQAANGTYSSAQRTALQRESNSLTAEYNRVIASTKFNGRAILDGTSAPQLVVQAGTDSSAASRITVDLSGLLGSGSTSGSGNQTVSNGQAESISFDFGGTMLGEQYFLSVDTWDQYLPVGTNQYSLFNVIAGGVETQYYLWYRVNGVGGDPIGGPNGTVIDISTNEDPALIYADVAAALSANPYINVSGDGSSFSITNREAGNVSSPEGLMIGEVQNGTSLTTGDYFLFSTTSQNYYVWFTSDGSGNPGGLLPGRTGIRVDFDSTQDSQLVLDNVIAAVGGALSDGSAKQNASPYALDLTIENAFPGAVSAPSTIGITNGMAFAVNTTGSASAVDPAADTITIASHGYSTAQALTLSSTGILPGGLSAGTYYAIVVNSNTIKLATSIANANAGTAVNIANYGVGTMTFGTSTSTTVATPYLSDLDLGTQASARTALATIDAQMQTVTSALGTVGAGQSRLASALNYLSVARENALAAAGRITNADIGAESAELIRLRILQQAGSAVLAQANLGPQMALQLLRA